MLDKEAIHILLQLEEGSGQFHPTAQSSAQCESDGFIPGIFYSIFLDFGGSQISKISEKGH